MSTISAALVKVGSLTVNGLGAGAVTATNLNFNNLGVAGALNVSGNATINNLSLPLHQNLDSALSAVETKMDTIKHLVRDPSLPTFEELERTNAQFYGNPYTVNETLTAPDYYSKRISHKNRSVDVRWPEHTYKKFDIDQFEDTFKRYFAWCDKFLPDFKVYPRYAHHNIQGREPFIFDVSGVDVSGNVLCVANNDVVIGAEWYSCAFDYDQLGNSNLRWYMLFNFKYSDTGASENFTGIPTHIRVITPRKTRSSSTNLSPTANGCVFINYIPLTTNATTHASNVTGNINSALWYDGVLSINAQIYDNVEHTTAFTNLLNTTTRNKVIVDFNAVNFFKSPSFTNVYKSYSLTPEAFIQKGNANIQNWANGSIPDTITERDSSNNMYDGLVAMTYNVGQDQVSKFSNYHEKYNWYAFAYSDRFIKVPSAPYNAPQETNQHTVTWILPTIANLNSDGGIDMYTYTRAMTGMSLHEYMHSMQQTNTSHYRVDGEAVATYVEYLPALNNMKDFMWWNQDFFKLYPRNSVSNTKSFLGPLSQYNYDFALFFHYMSKYDTVDSEFERNPRFFAEMMKLLANRTYSYVDSSGELNNDIYGIGWNPSGLPLIDSSGELTQFDIYNGAYKILKGDSSANILASEYENIVMASILNISKTEGDTTYAGSHANISNWTYPDFMNFKAYKAEGLREMEAKGELKPMIRSIISQAVKDAPKLSKYSPEFLVNKNYTDLLVIAANGPITTSRTKGVTPTEVTSIPGAALIINLEPYSSLTMNALQSTQTIVSSSSVIVRTVYFPSEGNLTIQDISPVYDASGYTYTVTDTSSAVIVVINNTPNSVNTNAPGLLPMERFTDGTTLWLPEHDVIITWAGTVVDAYTNITSQMVVVGKPTTNLDDMIGANGMKIGYYADFFDASGVSCVTDKIAICRRGVSNFGIKANNAWLAGAKGLFIIDNTETASSLSMSASLVDIGMTIPVWRIRPSWYHANIAPYLVASADGRYATTSFTANWATNYQYAISNSPDGYPAQMNPEYNHDYTIADVTDVTDGDSDEM